MNKDQNYDIYESDCECDAVVRNNLTSIIYIAGIAVVSIALLLPLALIGT